MSSILVTGGLGAVGSYLVGELESRGHDVYVIEHFPKHPLDVFAEIFRILKKDYF